MPSAGATDPAGVKRDEPLFSHVNNDKKRVAYFYDSDIGNYAYVTGHPMKPHRIRLAHALVMNYGVHKYIEIYRAKPATSEEMTQFHTDEYIDFLQKVTPDNMDTYFREQTRYNVGDDCPVFDGLFEFCGISAGGSMEGAARLNRQKCDIAINWAGGLHHAKKSEASGFCYVNDIVLAILELLRYNKRVLYVDIDVHHGDGVEEAFYTTDRVMTCSFHKYGEYFPGTGELRDVGIGQGKHYAVNFPLRDGIDDVSYETIFEPVIDAVMKYYQPNAVVLQCGGDSLSGDRLGAFNLSMRGHANCVNFVRSFNLPTLVLGGGGYTMRNVARTWAYETGRLVGVEMHPTLPFNEYYEYYGPDYELDVRSSNMENANSYEYLEKIKNAVIENLKRTAPVPSVQMQDVPRQGLGMSDEQEDELDDIDADENKDVRQTRRQYEKHVARQDEFEESDDEEMAEAVGERFLRRKNKTVLDYRNPLATDEDFDIGMHPSTRNGDTAAPENNQNDDTVTMDVDEPPANDKEKTAAENGQADVGAKEASDRDGDVNMVDADETAPATTIKKEDADVPTSESVTSKTVTATDAPNGDDQEAMEAESSATKQQTTTAPAETNGTKTAPEAPAAEEEKDATATDKKADETDEAKT